MIKPWKNKLKCILIFLILSTTIIQAQNKEWYLIDSIPIETLTKDDKKLIDSVLKVYHNSSSEIQKLQLLLELSENLNNDFVWPKYNDLILQKIKSVTETNDVLKIKAKALNNLGFLHDRKGENSKALLVYKEAMAIAKQINDVDGLSGILNNIAVIYNLLGDYKNSIKYHKESLQLKEKTGNQKGIAMSLSNMAVIYFSQGLIKNAEEYHMKALEIRKKIGDKNGLAETYVNLGTLKADSKNYELADMYFNISISLYRETGNKLGEANVLTNLAVLYENTGKPDKALEYLESSLKIKESIGYKYGLIDSYVLLCDHYRIAEDKEKEKMYALKAFEQASETGFKESKSKAANRLYHIYKAEKNHLKALEFLEIFKATKDSINSNEFKKLLFQQKYQHDYELKTASDSIKSVEEKKVLLTEIKHQKTTRNFYLIILALIVLFSIFIYNRFVLTKKQKHIIEEQKRIVDEKQQEIFDSINYAKLIQESLLASKETLDKNLENYFVLYKPKDIVSGDFYWASESNSGFLIACVDCTGHGVPGAFMSLIGKENLDKAVSKTNKPGEILSELNKSVKRTLNQNENTKSRDGMDAAILRIEKQNNETTLHYSGANRPLYIIKQNTETVLEVKATKCAIGGFTPDEQAFDEHILKLENGDFCVISTDGYADQFGEENNKKLTSKRFKELLISVHSKEPGLQKEIIENYFNNWKGSNEQVDDILVIGIKV